MTDPNLLFALVSFYFVMYVTPGPNNAMVLTSGLKFGFTNTIPHMFGITIGHVLQLFLVCFGLGKIFQLFPKPLLTEDQLELLKYDNIISGVYKTNFDIGFPAKKFFTEEVTNWV